MAISKELRNYIQRVYDKKLADLKSEQEKEIRQITKQIEKEMNQKFSSFKEVLSQIATEVQDQEGIVLNYYVRNLFSFNQSLIEVSSTHPSLQTIKSEYAKKIEQVEREKEKLLVKLSLEKDFDNINNLLGEYDIGFE